MPRILRDVLQSVFYLYESKEDAEQGESTGGTGFFINIRSEKYPERFDLYAVTCKHIVKPKDPSKRTPAPIMRINTFDGKSDTLLLTPEDWHTFEDIYPTEKHDIAIHELREINRSHFRVASLDWKMLISEHDVANENVGPGDDVYMVGRFIDQSGKQRNAPSVRFGNVSMMPGESFWHEEEKIEEDCFIVELRSLPGYSGSPIMVYHNVPLAKPRDRPAAWNLACLGIQWAISPHQQYQEEVGRYVSVYSGMSGVIPGWHITKLLNCTEFKVHRQENDIKHSESTKHD